MLLPCYYLFSLHAILSRQVNMYNPEVLFSTDDYILTSTRNVISRSATIHKPSALEIPLGRCFIAHGVVIRADLAQVQIQKYTFIGQGTVLQPCSMSNDPLKHIPLSIGSHCSIGQRCMVEAAVIGIGCSIGDDCNLSKRWNSIHLSESKAGWFWQCYRISATIKPTSSNFSLIWCHLQPYSFWKCLIYFYSHWHLHRCILKDFTRVENGTTVPADMVIPPFSIVAGSPAKIVGEVPEGIVTMLPNNLVERFKSLKQIKSNRSSIAPQVKWYPSVVTPT